MNSEIKELNDCYVELEAAIKADLKSQKRLMLAQQRMRAAKGAIHNLEADLYDLRKPE